MSMTRLTVIQTLSVFCAYFSVTVILPMIVMGKRISKRRLSRMMMDSFILGNIYITNLVFTLELLHIANRFTLIIGTIVPAVLIYQKVSNVNFIDNIKIFINDVIRGLIGILKPKMFFRKYFYQFRNNIRKFLSLIIKTLLYKFSDVLLITILLFGLVATFGPRVLNTLGYTASDIPVHLYWVNGLIDNKLFVAGIYPEAMHAIVYYIAEVFKIDAYVVFRVLPMLQIIFINMMLLAFLKLVSRSRYLPYVFVYLYSLGGFFQKFSFDRMMSALPQEFGMIFIFPSVYYVISFIKNYRVEELKYRRLKKSGLYSKEKLSLFLKIKNWINDVINNSRRADISLIYFAFSVSLAFACHFYVTMAEAFIYAGLALGFCFLIFRWNYLYRIIIAGLAGVMLAIVPMGIAFAEGTPLQGSIGWGLSLFVSEDKVVTETNNPNKKEIIINNNTITIFFPEGKTDAEKEKIIKETIDNFIAENKIESPEVIYGDEEEVVVYKEPFMQRMKNKIISSFELMDDSTGYYDFKNDFRFMSTYVFEAIIISIVLGLIYLIFKEYIYAGVLMSSGFIILMLVFFQSMKSLGLPMLMQPQRVCIFLDYSLPFMFCMITDGILYLITLRKRKSGLRSLVSFTLVFAALYFMAANGLFKGNESYMQASSFGQGLQTNEAVTCLTNIIKENDDFTWTIVSANDELQMGIQHGYHVETIDFLKDNEKYRNNKQLYIPTPNIYIFIEKKPLDYSITYEGSGQYISEEGADNPLPQSNSINSYKAKNRWIVMSRMYYWAETYKKLYPNEMTVYFEDDDFICYKIEQNVNRLFNLTVDYSYNTKIYY